MPWKAGFRRKTVPPRLAMSAFVLHQKPNVGTRLRCPSHLTVAEHPVCPANISNPWPAYLHGLPYHGDRRLKLTALHAHFSPKGAMPDLIGQDRHLHHPAAISTSSVAIPLICGGSAVITLFQVYMAFPPLPGADISACQGWAIGSMASAAKDTKHFFLNGCKASVRHLGEEVEDVPRNG